MFSFPPVFTSWQALGMQPELLYPRRSRFAPKGFFEADIM
jgi:hypothetical protein